MNSGIKPTDHAGDGLLNGTAKGGDHHRAIPGELDRPAVARELELILASPFFHNSKRSQQFLKCVVQHRLDGNEEPLKERTIGTMLYNRPADYATGDDSVVRVQAGEVRRRLEQYYKEPPSDSLVHIDLPLGSYAPEFHWSATAHHVGQPVANQEAGLPDSAVAPDQIRVVAKGRGRTGLWVTVSICILASAAVLTGYVTYQKRISDRALNQFWAPIFATSKPALICLPKTVLYRPSMALFKRSEKTPGEFDNEVDRMNGRPHLKPNDPIRWGDMVEFPDFGVGKGDVKAAFRLSSLLIKLGKDTELRVGNDYGWDDLRNAPAVIIGAFSNQWTMKITSGLHFAFAEDNGVFRIQEHGGEGRAWYDELDPRTSLPAEDYGLVTRLVNSGTGQFVITVAGITAPGSEAAAEVASSQDELEKALRNAPRDWKRRNVQIVVKTTVTEGVAGPAQIVAVYVW
ncbi:MAG TPA: hypothetical protein VME23_19385 [Terracidiphilus sp.]|nr:hypothetical protein [Terracidiphilus sp.]